MQRLEAEAAAKHEQCGQTAQLIKELRAKLDNAFKAEENARSGTRNRQKHANANANANRNGGSRRKGRANGGRGNGNGNGTAVAGDGAVSREEIIAIQNVIRDLREEYAQQLGDARRLTDRVPYVCMQCHVMSCSVLVGGGIAIWFVVVIVVVLASPRSTAVCKSSTFGSAYL